MNSGVFYRWKKATEAAARELGVELDGSGASPGCSGRRGAGRGYRASGPAGFGVRRPLRFMASRLELDEEQVAQLAQIINKIKTERAQGTVDDQRTLGELADAVESADFDQEGVLAALERRVESAKRMKSQVAETLANTHALLTEEQRKKLAYLLRSGGLTI